MPTPPLPPPSVDRSGRAYAWIAGAATSVTGLMGMLTLGGWWWQARALVQLDATSVPMQPNTALGLLALGVGGMAVLLDRPWTARACAFLAAILGAATLSQDILGVSHGLDQLLVRPFPTDPVVHAGRMAPETALALCFGGVAVAYLAAAPRRGRLFSAVLLGMVIGWLGTWCLFGHALRIPDLMSWNGATRMAPQTGAALLVFALTILALAWRKRAARGGQSRHWGPSFAGWGLVAVTLLLAQGTQAYDSSRRAIAFEHETRDAFGYLDLWIQRVGQTVQSLAALYAASKSVEPDEFQAFSRHIVGDQSLAVVLAWAPHVADAERRRFESDAAESRPGYRILEFATDGRSQPVARREEYFPLLYVEPAEPNQAAFGFDLAGEPDLRTTVRLAVERGTVTASRPISWLRDPPGLTSVVFVAPIYRNGAPTDSLAERRESMLGVVSCTVRVRDLIAAAAPNLLDPTLALRLYEGSVDNPNGSFVSTVAGPDTSGSRLHHQHTLAHFDLHWLAICEALPEHPANRMSLLPWIVLIGGLTLSWLLTLYLMQRSRQVARTEELVAERTEELRRANEALLRENTERQRAVEVAQVAARTRGDFVANMSHEIRTPLTAILGLTEALSDDAATPRQSERLRLLQSAAESLLALVNEVLEFSKLEARGPALRDDVFTLAEPARKVVESLRDRAARKDVALHLDIEAGVPERVRGDAHRLEQILYNLVGNAVKFTARGTVVVRVQVAEPPASSAVAIRFGVADTGIGIDPAQVERIFAPFEQADASVTRRFGGTGLGLAISSRLVEAMGGRIEVTSAPGRGSEFRFTVRFPLADPAEPHAAPQRKSDSAARRLTVLVAEDNEINRNLIADMVERAGHEVAKVGDGMRAIEACRNRSFDVVLMDVQMPGMDGLAATRAIRAQESGTENRAAILALTADVVRLAPEECRAAGIDGILGKPVRNADLTAAIAAAGNGSFTFTPGAPTQAAAAAASTPVSDAPPWTPEAALALVDHDVAIFRDMAGGFLRRSGEMAAGLRAATEQRDAARLARDAHRLKGTLGFFRHASASAALATVERAGQTADWPACAAGVADLEASLSDLCRGLDRFLKEHPA